MILLISEAAVSFRCASERPPRTAHRSRDTLAAACWNRVLEITSCTRERKTLLGDCYRPPRHLGARISEYDVVGVFWHIVDPSAVTSDERGPKVPGEIIINSHFWMAATAGLTEWEDSRHLSRLISVWLRLFRFLETTELLRNLPSASHIFIFVIIYFNYYQWSGLIYGVL